MPFEPVPTTSALSATTLTYNGSTPLFQPYQGVAPPPAPPSELLSPVLVRSADESKTAYIEVGNVTGRLSLTAPPNGTLQLTAGNGNIIMANGNGAGPVFAIDNDGDLTVTSAKSIALYPAYQDPTNNVTVGLGNVLFPSNQGSSNASLTVDNSGNCGIQAQGNLTFGMPTGKNLQIQKGTGAIGQVYDTVYNPIPTPPTPTVFPQITFLAQGSPNPGVTAPITYTGTQQVVTGGIYQLQLSVEDATGLAGFLQFSATLSSAPGSSPINYSINSILNTSVALSNYSFQLVSGFFSPASGSIDIVLGALQTTNPWNGSWYFQLVRFA